MNDFHFESLLKQYAVLTYKSPFQHRVSVGSLKDETTLRNTNNYFSGFGIAVLTYEKTENIGWSYCHAYIC